MEPTHKEGLRVGKGKVQTVFPLFFQPFLHFHSCAKQTHTHTRIHVSFLYLYWGKSCSNRKFWYQNQTGTVRSKAEGRLEGLIYQTGTQRAGNDSPQAIAESSTQNQVFSSSHMPTIRNVQGVYGSSCFKAKAKVSWRPAVPHRGECGCSIDWWEACRTTGTAHPFHHTRPCSNEDTAHSLALHAELHHVWSTHASAVLNYCVDTSD